MEKILNFATEHKKALAYLYLAKHIITAVAAVAIIAVIWHAYNGPINAVNSFSEGVHNISETRTEIQAISEYLDGKSDDTSEISDSMLETIEKVQKARELHAQLAEAHTNNQDTSELFDSYFSN